MVKLQFRHGTTAQWAASNPTLALGEPGINTTNNEFKIGDGSTPWTSATPTYAPYSFLTNAPRGIVAVGAVYDPVPTIAANVYMTPILQYTFDPTRRYRSIYRLRALAGAPGGGTGGTFQFWMVNARASDAQVGADHITSADASFYSGCIAEWLFTFNGLADLRIKTSTFFSGTTTTAYGGEWYIEDVGKI